MFLFRAFMTAVNIFMILVFLGADMKTKMEMQGAFFISLALICNTILIWS